MLNFKPDEEPTALIALKDWNQTGEALFAIGTVFYEMSEKEPSRGRLLVVACRQIDTVTSENNYEARIIAEADTEGCVYSIAELETRLVIAVNTGVRPLQLSISFC